MKCSFLAVVLLVSVSCCCAQTGQKVCPSTYDTAEHFPLLKIMIGHLNQFLSVQRLKGSTVSDIEIQEVRVACDYNPELPAGIRLANAADRKQLKDMLAFEISTYPDSSKPMLGINPKSRFYAAADKASSKANSGVDFVIAEGKILREFIEVKKRGAPAEAEAPSIEITYVSQEFEKLFPTLSSDQQRRAEEYLSALRSQKPGI